ncbi:ArdC family protein [Rhizocola hellebori]|nr:ArdC family protein [Rhizocola hellebori]
MAKNQKSAQEREELLDNIKADFDARLAKLAADPDEWVTFIETVARFGAQYTLHNQFLLLMQAEERQMNPTFFLPFGNRQATSGWRKHGRSVRKGEKAFYVWAPIKRRPSEEEAARWEAEGRKVARDERGRPAIQVVGFRLSPTFDLSQTDGDPFEVPSVRQARHIKVSGGLLPQLLEGDDLTGAYDDIVKLIKDAGYAFDLAAPGTGYLGSANGVTVTGPGVRQVLVRDDVSAAQRTKTTLHELAHIRCEHTTGVRLGENLHRGRKETEAESIAHLVCRALGLDSRAYTDAYVLGWANGDMDLVKECAQTVLRVAKAILADLNPAVGPAEPADDGDTLADQ